jgi:HEAT repeat protein
MVRKFLTMTILAVALSACSEKASEDKSSQDNKSFLQSAMDRVLVIFKSKTTDEETQKAENIPAKATQNSTMALAVQSHLAHIGADMQSASEISEQKTSKQDLEQYHQDYAQAVNVDDKLFALAALVQADQKHAIPLLKEAYESQEPELRKGAVLQMQTFNDKKEVVDLLLKALDDPEPDVVIEVVEGLASNKNKRVVEGLKKVANSHPDQLIREVAQDYVNQVEINTR